MGLQSTSYSVTDYSLVFLDGASLCFCGGELANYLPCLFFSSGSHQSFIASTIQTYFLSIYTACQALCEKERVVSNSMSFIPV